MKKWAYYRLHIPGQHRKCGCAGDSVIQRQTTNKEMSELEFYKWLSWCNHSAQGHWQYWDAEY